MDKLILVSGKANVGKDTTIDLMIEYLQEKGYRCTKLAFAKYLKDICKNHLGWNGEKDEKGRTMLQYVGTDIIRDKLGWNTFHVNRVCEDIKIIEDQYDFIFISDARFANELYFTKSVFLDKCTDLLVIRPNLESLLDNKQLSHKSENSLGDYRHKHRLNNSGDLKFLKLSAMAYCDVILLEGEVKSE